MSPHQSPHYTSVTHQKSPHYSSPSPHPPPIKPHPNTTGGSPAKHRTSPRHPSAPRQQQQSSSYQCDPSQQRWNPLEKNKVKKNLPGVTPPLLICPNQNLLKVAPSCKDRVQVNGGGPGRAPLHQVQDRKKKMDLTEHFPLLPFPALPIKGAEKGRSMKGKIWKSIDKKMNLFTLTSCVAFSHHLKAKDYLVDGGTCSRLASDTIGGGTSDSNFKPSDQQPGSTLDFNFADSFDSSSSLATPDLLLHSKATPERSEEEALQPDNHLSSSFSNRQQLMSDQEGLFENVLLKGNLYLLLLLLMKPVIWAFIKCIKLT